MTTDPIHRHCAEVRSDAEEIAALRREVRRLTDELNRLKDYGAADAFFGDLPPDVRARVNTLHMMWRTATEAADTRKHALRSLLAEFEGVAAERDALYQQVNRLRAALIGVINAANFPTYDAEAHGILEHLRQTCRDALKETAP